MLVLAKSIWLAGLFPPCYTPLVESQNYCVQDARNLNRRIADIAECTATR